MIAIIDYNLGNTGSIVNMLKRIGYKAIVTADPEVIRNAEKLILPGVGHFGEAMENLHNSGLLPVLEEKVIQQDTPILGICLGMQLMGTFSEEGDCKGLGWIDAEIRRFDNTIDPTIKIPHMGWNEVHSSNNHPLMNGLKSNARFYFVHSYHAVCSKSENVLFESVHGYRFTAAFMKNNIYGVQFHPEKSHRFGMTLLTNFVEKC
jgi:glutamine amidotransferase